LSVLTYTYLYSIRIFIPHPPHLLFHLFLFPLFNPPFRSCSSSPLFSQYSFYTCRYLHILIYILSLKNNLTPHVLSEWMVEVCRFEVYWVGLCFDPAQIIGGMSRVV
jgi:hypothetical protein